MTMKKITSVLICTVMLLVSVLPLTAFAWETPSLDLNITYNERKKIITVDYIVHDAAGIESADFRLRFDSDVLEFDDYTPTDIKNTYLEVGVMSGDKDKVAIQFVDLYHVYEDDCEEDGSILVATLTFKVKDKSASDVVFIATADSCAMDPDSEDISLSRYTQKFSLTDAEGSSDTDTSVFGEANVKKIIIAAVITLIVFVGGTAAVVIKYRKKND